LFTLTAVDKHKTAKRKSPAFRRDLSHSDGISKLALVLVLLVLTVLPGLVALAHRILPLLSGFLTAALLLTGALLAGVLSLLARILVLLLRHSGNLPGWMSRAG
jgi:hypothetical protein